MNTYFRFGKLVLGTLTLAATLCFAASSARATATITIINNNAAGVGFNDPTPAAPVGGNPGTTLGQQRLNAFQYAASIWGASLDSTVEIRIGATFEALTCTATSAVLGSAGATQVDADFPGAVVPGTWYCVALASKLAGTDLASGSPHITARFNSNLGNAGCLTGTFWYLGFDGNHGNNVDLVAVLLHEFGHGLGFQQFANITTGANLAGLTDVYARNILDTTTGKTWSQMTDAERVVSATNTSRVVWKGAEVTSGVPCVLGPSPMLRVNSPPSVAGKYPVGTAAFGPPLTVPGVTGTLALASPNLACGPLANPAAVAGKIAVVDRGTCTFVVKVKAAQDAGAIGVIVADNVQEPPPAGLGGSDPTITIPAVRITLNDANVLKAAMVGGPVSATIGLDSTQRSGTDPLGRVLLYTPNPRQVGSTISHWDTSAFPNLLMEPAINGDLTHNLFEPYDLTLAQMRDIGWFPGFGHTKYDLNWSGCVDLADYNALNAAIRAHSTNPMYDLNCDGKVDIADARVLVLHFSKPGGAACP